jgi:hypothetical protein
MAALPGQDGFVPLALAAPVGRAGKRVEGHAVGIYIHILWKLNGWADDVIAFGENAWGRSVEVIFY